MSYTSPNTADTAADFIFNSGQRVAVIVTGIIGSISTLSVSSLLLHLFTVSFVSGRTQANKDERIFLRMHLGAFVVCLLTSDLIQGISGMFQLVWAKRGGVYDGPLCKAQAAMLLFGDNGTAFWNAVIGIHTFWTVVLGKRMSTVAVAFLIAAGWTLCVILTVIGPLAIQTAERGPFYSIAGAWCFVTTEYRDSRIYLHYLPMLLSAFIITILYILVAMVLFGVLVVDHNGWRLKAPPRRRGKAIRDFFGQFSWGRLGRPTGGSVPSQPSSGGIKSANIHGRPQSPNHFQHQRSGSIKLASIPITKAEEAAGVNGAPVMDISAPRPDSGRISESERGRPSLSKAVEIKEEPKHRNNVQTHVSLEPSVHVSGQSMQLRTLAIKMLWYPIVYMTLILPISISRVDSSMEVALSVMLAFMCLLWLMGTANTIIYVCTRRLGPTPWARRNRSISRTRSTRSTATREAGPNFNPNNNGVQSVQIFVDRHTHRATDEQFMERTRHKSFVASFPAEIENASDSSSPPNSTLNTPTRREFAIGDKEKRLSVASRGSTPPSTFHPPLPTSLASPIQSSELNHRISSPPLTLSPPPSRQGRTQGQDQTLQALHRATFSHPPNLQDQSNTQQPPYRLTFFEDNDSVRTHSRKPSSGSAL